MELLELNVKLNKENLSEVDLNVPNTKIENTKYQISITTPTIL